MQDQKFPYEKQIIALGVVILILAVLSVIMVSCSLPYEFLYKGDDSIAEELAEEVVEVFTETEIDFTPKSNE